MKVNVLGALCLLFMISSCSDDKNGYVIEPEQNLFSPKITAMVNDEQGYSPLTGILEAYPCNSGGSVYFGNYVNGKQTPFNGYYTVVDGHVSGENNRVLNLPDGAYNMVYWATPKYEEPTYSTPAISEPGITIGADLSKLYFKLRANEDGTYMPVFDMVHAVHETDTEADFEAQLERVVAGLKVIVRNEDNGIFSSDILKMQILVHDIAESLNAYTAEPENKTKTVKFDLVRAEDGTSMSNATVMLFPSADMPSLDLIITTQDGKEHKLAKQLQTTLEANTRLTLNIVLGKILPEGNTGNFTIQNWKEASETIYFSGKE